MDTLLFKDMLGVDSTSGRERTLADFLVDRLRTDCNKVERFDVVSMSGDVPGGSGIPQNILFSVISLSFLFFSKLHAIL